jgi:F0F1-type ATP synthase membrane subunit b/b'
MALQAQTIEPEAKQRAPSESRLDAAAKALPRRQFFNDMPDKGLFALTAVLGFPAIMALKLYDVDARIVAAIAVILMVVYGVLAYRLPAVQLRLDRLGDNYYYLGFIYTLASMSAALLQISNRADSLDAVLGSFGIALFTTIVGVAGRVLFVQLRGEIDEVEAMVRRDLLAASNDLKGQLALSLREFETFHVSVLQVAGEGVKTAAAAAETQIERISEAGKATANEIHQAFEGNRRNVEKIDDAAAEIGRKVEDLATRLDELFIRLVSIVDELSRARHRGRRRWWWPLSRR